MKYLLDVASLELFPETCTGCGMCVEVCPHEVFGLVNKKAVILDKDRCMECGACVNNCAFGALSVDRGVGCAAALINSMITGGEPSCGCSEKSKAKESEEEKKMDDRTKELIAVGASVTANCQPCLQYHVSKALESGANEEEIREAVSVAKMVRKGAMAKMDQFSSAIFKTSEVSESALEKGCGCS